MIRRSTNLFIEQIFINYCIIVTCEGWEMRGFSVWFKTTIVYSEETSNFSWYMTFHIQNVVFGVYSENLIKLKLLLLKVCTQKSRFLLIANFSFIFLRKLLKIITVIKIQNIITTLIGIKRSGNCGEVDFKSCKK